MAGYLINADSGVAVFWMQKSGCTLLKNLFYLLNTGEHYPDPIEIHFDKAALSQIRYRPKRHSINRDASFAVIREPVARIVSFYWDKIYSTGPYSMAGVRGRLSRAAKTNTPDWNEFDCSEDLCVEGHRNNLAGLLDAIAGIFQNPDSKLINGHFAKQSAMIQNGGAQDLQIVPLDGFARSLPKQALAKTPNLGEALGKMPRMNESRKIFPASELLTDPLRDRIIQIYSQDSELYHSTTPV